MNTQKHFIPFLKLFTLAIVCSLAVFAAGCDDDDPVREDTPELITRATLTFTPTGGGSPVVVSATDPDGVGVRNLEVEGKISLLPHTTYVLEIGLINELADPSSAAYDITEEISEESDEHLFFFGWTGNIFSDPSGNGNIDTRSDAVNYEDDDEKGQPLGVKTTWTTGDAATGEFTVILKHQPDIKSATSSSSDGETDLDVTWDIEVE